MCLMQINTLAVLSSNSLAQGDDSHLSKTYYIWHSQEFYQGLKREGVSQNISSKITEKKMHRQEMDFRYKA